MLRNYANFEKFMININFNSKILKIDYLSFNLQFNNPGQI